MFLKREEIKPPYNLTNPTNLAATGRFTFRQKNLYFSFYVSDRARRPYALQFIDEKGHILNEMLLLQASNMQSIYQDATGKVCGVWHRVSRDYRKMLRDEKMYVVLLWAIEKKELALAGKIMKMSALKTEQLTSLLETSTDVAKNRFALGAGGTAIISTSSGETSSIHLTLLLSGLFANDTVANVPLGIRLESRENGRTILNDSVLVEKINYEYNVVDYQTPISMHDLGLLTHGQVNLIVESHSFANLLRIQGAVVTRATCDIYQTVLAPTSATSQTRTSGMAWAYVDRNGSLIYNIRTDQLNLEERPLISLIDDSGKRKVEFQNLTPSLNVDRANGILTDLAPRALKMLYSNSMAINIATGNDDNLVHGKLVGRPLGDSRDAIEPIMLNRTDPTTPSHLVGMAWFSIDNDCTAHYEMSLTGHGAVEQELELYLEQKPMEAINAPIRSRLLELIRGYYVEGYVMGLETIELMQLEQTVCHLQVKTKQSKQIILSGRLRNIRVPNHCYPKGMDLQNDHIDNELPSTESKCYHESSNRYYDESAQWQSGCSICACIYGKIKCDKVECPPLNCKNGEVARKINDECCPICICKYQLKRNFRKFSKYSISRKINSTFFLIMFSILCSANKKTRFR